MIYINSNFLSPPPEGGLDLVTNRKGAKFEFLENRERATTPHARATTNQIAPVLCAAFFNVRSIK